MPVILDPDRYDLGLDPGMRDVSVASALSRVAVKSGGGVVSAVAISLTVKNRETIQTRYFIHGYFRRLWLATTRERPSCHSFEATFTNKA
jgi:hypothetical protein